MTVDDLITAVRNYTGANSTVLPDATVLEFVNGAIRKVQRAHPFRGEAISIDLTVPAATSSVNLPPDFVSETGVWAKSATATDPTTALTPIVKTQRRFWIESQGPTSVTLRDTVFPQVQAPQVSQIQNFLYYLFAGALYIVPKPSADLLITLDYTRLLSELVAGQNQTNVFTVTFPDLIRLGALYEAYMYLHEEERAVLHGNAFETELRRSMHFDDSLALSGPPQQRGK